MRNLEQLFLEQKLTSEKKREKTEHQKKTIPGLFGGIQCSYKTVRDNVLSIVGSNTLQCIKTAGKNGSKDEVPFTLKLCIFSVFNRV